MYYESDYEPIKVNLSFDVSRKEQVRLCLAFLRKEFKLDYQWEDDEIVKYESAYHNQVDRIVVKKITDEDRAAKTLYDFLSK